MSVLHFGGLPGSGKSYGVVENIIIPALKKGRHIVTNIPLRMGYITEDFPKAKITSINLDHIKDGTLNMFDLPKGSIIILDEIYSVWPSGIRTNEIAEEHRNFFAQHRHIVDDETGYTTEIVLISQNQSQIAAFCRNLIDKSYIAHKKSALSLNNAYNIKIVEGKVFDVDKIKNNDVIREIKGTYKKDVYQYYKSHTKSDSGIVGNEENADSRATIWKSSTIMIGFPLSIITLIFCINKMISIFNSSPEPSTQQTQNIIHQDNNQKQISQSQIKKLKSHKKNIQIIRPTYQLDVMEKNKPLPQLPLSEQWRVGGYLQNGNTKIVLLTNDRSYIEIPMRGNCITPYKDAPEQIECTYSGERVTNNSGSYSSHNSFGRAVNIASTINH